MRLTVNKAEFRFRFTLTACNGSLSSAGNVAFVLPRFAVVVEVVVDVVAPETVEESELLDLVD